MNMKKKVKGLLKKQNIKDEKKYLFSVKCH